MAEESVVPGQSLHLTFLYGGFEKKIKLPSSGAVPARAIANLFGITATGLSLRHEDEPDITILDDEGYFHQLLVVGRYTVDLPPTGAQESPNGAGSSAAGGASARTPPHRQAGFHPIRQPAAMRPGSMPEATHRFYIEHGQVRSGTKIASLGRDIPISVTEATANLGFVQQHARENLGNQNLVLYGNNGNQLHDDIGTRGIQAWRDRTRGRKKIWACVPTKRKRSSAATAFSDSDEDEPTSSRRATERDRARRESSASMSSLETSVKSLVDVLSSQQQQRDDRSTPQREKPPCSICKCPLSAPMASCQQCGQVFHVRCVQEWRDTCDAAGNDCCCPHCRDTPFLHNTLKGLDDFL